MTPQFLTSEEDNPIGEFKPNLPAVRGLPTASTTSSDSNFNLGVQALQQKARRLLKHAICSERAHKWEQVVEDYRSLIKILSKKRFPTNFKPPASYRSLMFEVYYHLGMALQYVGQHALAVKSFTKSLAAIGIVKGGCGKGCITSTCLQTPVLARRAFALAAAGKADEALNDAEKAIVLDNTNPDIYCIRALVWGTLGQEAHAVEDCKMALKLNSRHICGHLIKGAAIRVMAEKAGETLIVSKEIELNPDQKRAIELYSDTINYLDVSDFTKPKALEFYDRLLFSLNVPHTISEREFVLLEEPGEEGSYQPTVTTSHGVRGSHYQQYTALPPPANLTPNEVRARLAKSAQELRKKKEIEAQQCRSQFKCGMCHNDGGRQVQTAVSGASKLWAMRKYYDTVIRSHSRGDNVKCDLEMSMMSRSSTRSKTMVDLMPHISRSGTTRDTRRAKSQEGIQRQMTQLHVDPFKSEPPMTRPSDRRRQNTKWQIGRPASVLPVFKHPNVENAPRMYVKPWAGDKIPIVRRKRVNQAKPTPWM